MNIVKRLFFTFLASISVFTISSCGSNTDTSTQFIDYTIKDEARLNLDYKGHDFLSDGIAQVTLQTAIDGDTAHFKEEGNDELIKCRFYGIDTPESTGKIQPYGKAASNFTKEKLTNANENGTIVISVPGDEYCVPSHDSTGTRYLALIWINETTKNADYKDLILLNLLLVQNGYSEVKNANEMPRLEDTFRAAWRQAQEYKLNLFSGEDDPLFNYGDYEVVSLLDMKIELEKEITASKNGETYENKFNNMNVKVVGTIVGFANNTIYLQNYYSKENGGRYEYGEYAGINIYTGMSSISSKFYKVNTYLQVCGTVSNSENFGFQISGCSWKAYLPGENDAQVLISPENNTDEFKMYEFERSIKAFTNEDYECVNSPVKFEEIIRVTGGYTSSSDSITLYLETEDGEKINVSAFIPFIYKPDASNPSNQWISHESFVGHTFKIAGVVALHKQTSGKYVTQIVIRSGSDLVLVD